MIENLGKQVSSWTESVARAISRRRFIHKSVKGAAATVAGVTLGSFLDLKQARGMTLATPYGIDCYNNPGTDKTGAQFLKDAVNAGYQWYRWILDWSAVEKTGVLDWAGSGIDAMVQAVNGAGLKLLIAVNNPPIWHTSPYCGDLNLMKPADAATFVHAMLNHYNAGGYGHIDAIEMGNEAFQQNETCPGGDVAAALMQACYPAIKSVDSTVLVGSPAAYMNSSLTPWWWGGFYGTGGGGPYIDWMSIHYYPCGIGPNKSPGGQKQTFGDGINMVISTAQSYGFDKPIWVTENSWTVGDGSCQVTDTDQSNYYQEILDDCRMSNTPTQQKVVKHFWFDMGSLINKYGGFRPAYTMVQGYIAQYPNW